MSWAPPDFLIEAANKALTTDISANHYRWVFSAAQTPCFLH